MSSPRQPKVKGPYHGKNSAELIGLRKDYAKMIQASVAARRAAETQLSMIAMAMEEAVQPPPYEASDHAVIRYLERVKGMDIQAIRTEMASECAQAKEICGDRIRIASGAIFCLNAERYITTVLPLGTLIDQVRVQVDLKEGAPNKSGRKRKSRRSAINGVLEDIIPLAKE